MADAPRPMGAMPRYLTMLDLKFPNAQAVVRSAFVPGLDEGFVPQGLARYGGDFLLSGYMSGGTHHSCRVYWVGGNDLAAREQFDVPVKCNHAGGIAVSPQGQIAIGDSGRLIVWTPSKGSIRPVSGINEVKFTGNIRGTFLSATAQGLVIGSYYKDSGVTAAQTFPWKILGYRDISPRDITTTVNLLPQTQGAVRLNDGYFWTSSQGNPNMISYVAPNGVVQNSFPFVRGLQGVVPGPNGTIWTVSESGAAPYTKRSDVYPSIMQIDPSKLVAGTGR